MNEVEAQEPAGRQSARPINRDADKLARKLLDVVNEHLAPRGLNAPHGLAVALRDTIAAHDRAREKRYDELMQTIDAAMNGKAR